jgi:hypothetical protein
MQETHIRNVTPERFGAWLEDHCFQLITKRFESDGGYFEPDRARRSGNLYQWTIDGVWHSTKTLAPDSVSTVPHRRENSKETLIQFDLWVLDDDRSKITSHLCVDDIPSLTAYYNELQVEIEKNWAVVKVQAGTSNAIESHPHKSHYIRQKIKDAYDDLKKDGLPATDEEIAARLPINQKGKYYSRETINRYRRAMRRDQIEV